MSLSRSDENEGVPLSTVGIVTRDRPALLRRCLFSFLRSAREEDLRLEFLIADDSRSRDGHDRTANLLREAAQLYPEQTFAHAHSLGRRTLTAYLRRHGASNAALRGLFGDTRDASSSPGANRNVLLLGTQGKRFLSVDDDAICGFTALGDRHPSWQWDRQDGVNGAIAFTAPDVNRQRARDGRTLTAFLRLHSTLLGGERSSSALTASRVSPAPARPTAAVTLSGIDGDCGIPDLRKFLLAEGRLRRRFLACLNNRGVEATRSILRGVPSCVLSSRGSIITTTATGFDHTRSLPPFVTGMRGEDSIFGAAARKLLDSFVVGHVPYAMQHAPEEERRYTELPTRLGPADLTLYIIENAAVSGSSFQERCCSLADQIQNHPAIRPGPYQARELLRLHQEYVQSASATCTRVLSRYRHRPRLWAEYVLHWRAELLDEQHRDPTVPGRSARGSIHQMRDFAYLLKEWPSISSVADSMRRSCPHFFFTTL